MKILGLIPARGGSKGIPKKNSKLLGGKALIRYSIEVGLACADIDQVLVSTDDSEIAKISKVAGAKVPFLRPAALATDQSPTIDTVIHALQFYQKQNIFFDAICLLQPTSPFRAINDLNQAIQVFQELDADSLISVREVPHHFNPHWVFKEKESSGFLTIATGEKDIISRRQDLPKAYHRDGSIYLCKSEVVLNHRSLFGEKIAHFLMKESSQINIDTPQDWEAAELEIKKGKW